MDPKNKRKEKMWWGGELVEKRKRRVGQRRTLGVKKFVERI